MYIPDHLFLLLLKFLLVILIETWYNLLVVYFVFAFQLYHKKTAFLSFSDKFAVFFIGSVFLQPLFQNETFYMESLSITLPLAFRVMYCLGDTPILFLNTFEKYRASL